MRKKLLNYFMCIIILCVSIVVSMSFNLDSKKRYLEATSTSVETSGTPTSNKSTGESLIAYAMKWNNNPNILYVYGGDRVHTLEELDAGKIGTDCSGYVTRVYKHFGYELPAQSQLLYNAAKKVINNESEAMPGDICWWSGHVGIYIGEGKLIHTNTKNPPNNIIHVSSFEDYRQPSAFLRMIDDEELKKITSGGSVEADEETKEAVVNAVSTGSVVTESDLTGLVIEETLLLEQKRLSLKTQDDLSDTDRESLNQIKGTIANTKLTPGGLIGKLTAFIGLVLMVYGVLVIVCMLFDYVNTFIEVRLLKIVSLGRWSLVDRSDIESGLVEDGAQGANTVYLSARAIVIRAIVIIGLGMLFVSGWLVEFIYSMLVRAEVL